MDKPFDIWNEEKKLIHEKKTFAFASPGEIWWCAIGENVGVEINGKHDNFERPVVIMKAFNTEMLFVIPLTTKQKNNRYYFALAEGKSWAVLSQARLVSAKRLIRKFSKIDIDSLNLLRAAYVKIWG